MKEGELVDDKLKKEFADKAKYEMESKRTDSMLEQELKAGICSVMYKCWKCKSAQVTCRTQ